MKILIALLFLMSTAATADYTFEYTNSKPWIGNKGDGTVSSTEVVVYGYVPGSNVQTTRNITLYTRAFKAKANIYGDKVGYKKQTYGTRYFAWANPYDGVKVQVQYLDPAEIGSTLFNVNDARLAIGNYTPIGANQGGFIYDMIDGNMTQVKHGIYSSTVSDLNNAGQVIGQRNLTDGRTREGFVYSCEGYQTLAAPDMSADYYLHWTTPVRIGEDGVIYGKVSGVPGFRYFIATPDTPFAPSCELARAEGEPTPDPTPEPTPEPESVCPPGTELDGYEDDGEPKCEDDPDPS